MTKIIFVCEKNSVRSVLAEALASKYLSGESDSAGLTPDDDHDAVVLNKIEELGLPIPTHPPRHLDDVMDDSAYYVALSENVFNALRSVPQLSSSAIEYWETPHPPVPDEHRDQAMKQIDSITHSLRDHMRNRFDH